MHKKILTVLIALCLIALMVPAASAELMRYSGGGGILGCGPENPYGLEEITPIFWSLTYDTAWDEYNQNIDLKQYLDQGASLSVTIGSWTFDDNAATSTLLGPITLLTYMDAPAGLWFGAGLINNLNEFSEFWITGDQFSFMQFRHSPVWGKLDFDHFSVSQTSAVPIPGAVWLLGSGLFGLAGLRKKSRH